MLFTFLNPIYIKVASDVMNPLCGKNGATYVYGPQKGASDGQLKQLEEGMVHFAEIVKRDLGVDLYAVKGAGAAGGLGAGCIAFLKAEIVKGIELLFSYSKAEEYIRNADFIITGEGKIDKQSLQGKVVEGVAALAKKYQKPVIALCGTLEIPTPELAQIGVTAAFSIINRPMSTNEAIENTASLLEDKAYSIAGLMNLKSAALF